MLLDSCCGTPHIVRQMHSVWQLEAQIIQSQSTKIHLHRHTILRIWSSQLNPASYDDAINMCMAMVLVIVICEMYEKQHHRV